MDFGIFDYCEHQAAPDATDPTLIGRLEFYDEIDPERLARYVSFLTGQAHKTWTMDDFTFQPRQSQPSEWFDEEDEEEPSPPDQARHISSTSVSNFSGICAVRKGSRTRGENWRASSYIRTF